MTTILESARSVQELHHKLAEMMTEMPSAGLGPLMAHYLAGRGELASLPIKSPVDALAILHLARQAIGALLNGADGFEPEETRTMTRELQKCIDNLTGYLETQAEIKIDALGLDAANQTVN